MHVRSLAVVLATLPALVAQEACDDSLDHRSQESAYMAVLGTAHFNVSQMRIPHQLMVASSYDDYWDKAMHSMVEAYQANSSGGSSSGTWSQVQDFVHDLTGDSGIAADAEAFMIGNAFAGLVSTLQSLNVGYRNYAFIAPVAGVYRIEVRLTGDIDKPRNRVIVSGSNFRVQLDDDNPSSDRTKVYACYLPKGAYSLTMALGSGSSATFHNAGTLTSILLDNPTPLTWDANFVVASNKIPLLATMPYPGSTTTGRVAYQVPTTTNFPSVITGSVVVDTLRTLPVCHQPSFVVTWRADAPYTLCVTLGTLSFYQAPELDPAAAEARYYFRRGSDVTRTYYVKGPMPVKTLDPQ
ncbi:MAG TPA: hypothetical protein VJ623_00040 [Holophagaceae bacterium]|nr:hypothetical protein [Holophagaceae bacterium]